MCSDVVPADLVRDFLRAVQEGDVDVGGQDMTFGADAPGQPCRHGGSSGADLPAAPPGGDAEPVEVAEGVRVEQGGERVVMLAHELLPPVNHLRERTRGSARRLVAHDPASVSPPKLRRRVSPFGVPPRAVEILSQDQPAARASRTASVIALWATRRASTAFFISSSIVAVMPENMPQNVARVEQ